MCSSVAVGSLQFSLVQSTELVGADDPEGLVGGGRWVAVCLGGVECVDGLGAGDADTKLLLKNRAIKPVVSFMAGG